jgi:acyl-CoA reductase-like NAD-dependent aldehyde dehydrogenase
VNDSKGRFLANASAASRKDARDAVQAACKAFVGWSARTPYNRGQVVYRVAEVLEGRRAQLADEVQRSEGVSKRQAETAVDESVDRLVWYAGWADKIAQVVGGTNPVSAPFFNFSLPEPTGVVAILAPQQSSLLGLVSVVAPVVVTGNTCVVASSHERPLPAITLAEVLATSDVPGGVVNVLTGALADTAATLASHMDVNAIDLTGLAGDPETARDLEVAAAENLKRVLRSPSAEPDWTAEPGLDRMTRFLETKTVWHPVGI